MAINSLLKLVSNTTVVEAGTPQGTVSHALVRLHIATCSIQAFSPLIGIVQQCLLNETRY